MPHVRRPSSNTVATAAPPLALAVIAMGFLATLVCGWRSDGYHHADDLSHFQITSWAWTWPRYLLHDWGRPGFTILYFLPAYFGWGACRAWSAVLSAVIAYLAVRIAQHLQMRRVWLVPLLLYAQPRFFTLAITTLTETALALYLTTAVYLALRQRWRSAAAVLSLGLIARHEAIAIVPVFVAFAWAQDVPLRRILPVVWAPLFFNTIAWVFSMNPSLALLAQPAGTGQYGWSGPQEFFARTIEAFGPALAALGFAGVKHVWRMRGGPFVVAVALTLFFTHVLLRTFGLFDTGGYARFLVPISPLWAILTAAAWNRLSAADPRARSAAARDTVIAALLLLGAMEIQLRTSVLPFEIPKLWEASWAVRIAVFMLVVLMLAGKPSSRAGAGAHYSSAGLRCGLAAVMALASFSLSGPLHPEPDERQIDAELAWLRDNGFADRPVVAAHAWVNYRTDRKLDPHDRGFAHNADAAPIGAIIIWDRKFTPFNHGPASLDDLTARNTTFRLLRVSPPRGDRPPLLYLFEKTSQDSKLTQQ